MRARRIRRSARRPDVHEVWEQQKASGQRDPLLLLNTRRKFDGHADVQESNTSRSTTNIEKAKCHSSSPPTDGDPKNTRRADITKSLSDDVTTCEKPATKGNYTKSKGFTTARKKDTPSVNSFYKGSLPSYT